VPSPLELLMDPVSWGVFALYLGLLVWERLRPARALPKVRGWLPRALLAFVLFFFVSSYLPLLLAEPLGLLALFDARGLGSVGGALVALLVYQLLLYGWHRALHTSDFLFRSFHQVHHSAERLDLPGAFWFSPLDMAGFTLLSALSLSVVGLTPAATTLFVLTGTLLSMFQHANLRTPRWLGYLIQRPESHSHHHARGVHRDNYADLPLFDLLFGSFENPQDFAPEAGFYPGASARLGEMLRCQDVSVQAGSPALSARASAPNLRRY
jgi:sterol desaturase/sphingolipid hydroxylase (fatty acid hydroxylase superfamily)